MPSNCVFYCLLPFEFPFPNAKINGSIKCMVSSVLKGAWLGFCIAAPVGPIGILVLKEALQRGRTAALASGLGAALADLIYGFLAIAGVRIVSGHARAVALTGGCFLLYLAWKSWQQTPGTDVGAAERKNSWGGTVTTFVLTLSNPMTILSFAAMVASTGADAPAHFVTGVFLGSLLWWTVLSTTAAWLRQWIEIRGVVLNRLSAATLGCFGLWAIWGKLVR
jgi:putative LysE/RhtB family amino acid efflux pump